MTHAAWLNLLSGILLSLVPKPALAMPQTTIVASAPPAIARVAPARRMVRAASLQAKTDQLWLNVQKLSVEDLAYARALAAASGTTMGSARAACWSAWTVVVGQAQSTSAGLSGVVPDASGTLASRFEQRAQGKDHFAPRSAFSVACAPLAKAEHKSLSTWVASVTAGK